MSTLQRLTAVAALATLALTGCGASSGSTQGLGTTKAGVTTLKVGASPTPHGDILRYIESSQAKAAGLDIQVVEFTDYVQPNKALSDKSIDANFFQHQPYLDNQISQYGYKLTSIEPVLLTPIAAYSQKVKALKDVPNGGTVSVPNDPTNEARALQLLADNGLVTLKAGAKQPTAKDIASNPKNIKISELDAAQTPRSLPDVDAAVINQNYAAPAHLNPSKDAVAIESAQNNPYANVLVVRTENKDDPAVKKLADLLCSTQTQDYIKKQFNGEVIVACPAK